MTSYSKYNLVYRLQKWMDSVPGQTFLNYAYSWGASIVILGTLFKLTHLPGANLMLFFGMGTEVVVFFLSAFDRPFDKTADGMDLPSHVTKEHLEGTLMPNSPQKYVWPRFNNRPLSVFNCNKQQPLGSPLPAFSSPQWLFRPTHPRPQARFLRLMPMPTPKPRLLQTPLRVRHCWPTSKW